jgi:hypothetical protein
VDKHYRELANRLFATAMAMLEDAIEPATRGQSSKASAQRLAKLADELSAAAQGVAAVAAAVKVVAAEGRRHTPWRRR